MTTVAAPVEFVEALADLRLPPQSDARLQALMDRNTDGRLTPAEREDLEALVELSERIALVRAEALRLLGQKDVIRQYIEKTPGVCGGKARIAGHRIRVMDVVALHETRGLSPEEIVHQYPGITLADVYAALAYYLDHREEIRADFRHDEELAESLRHRFPSKLQEKLRG